MSGSNRDKIEAAWAEQRALNDALASAEFEATLKREVRSLTFTGNRQQRRAAKRRSHKP